MKKSRRCVRRRVPASTPAREWRTPRKRERASSLIDQARCEEHESAFGSISFRNLLFSSNCPFVSTGRSTGSFEYNIEFRPAPSRHDPITHALALSRSFLTPHVSISTSLFIETRERRRRSFRRLLSLYISRAPNLSRHAEKVSLHNFSRTPAKESLPHAPLIW